MSLSVPALVADCPAAVTFRLQSSIASLSIYGHFV